jgi:DNA-binding MarR family transcriptional regulator
MSRALDGLVERGFVERLQSEHDRRAKLVRMLPAGWEALDTIERSRVSLIEEFTATLSDEELARLHAALLPVVERTPSP